MMTGSDSYLSVSPVDSTSSLLISTFKVQLLSHLALQVTRWVDRKCDGTRHAEPQTLRKPCGRDHREDRITPYGTTSTVAAFVYQVQGERVARSMTRLT